MKRTFTACSLLDPSGASPRVGGTYRCHWPATIAAKDALSRHTSAGGLGISRSIESARSAMKLSGMGFLVQISSESTRELAHWNFMIQAAHGRNHLIVNQEG